MAVALAVDAHHRQPPPVQPLQELLGEQEWVMVPGRNTTVGAPGLPRQIDSTIGAPADTITVSS